MLIKNLDCMRLEFSGSVIRLLDACSSETWWDNESLSLKSRER